jgi:hypothetical protein
VVQQEARRRLALIALGLERYRLAEGRLPEGLDILAPRFVRDVPLDPYIARPPRYARQTDSTFQLYSVAEDIDDDGGTSPFDLVWPTPVWPEP